MRILLFFIAFIITVNSYSRDFYVSNSGNDNNDGLSESSPWKSIEKVNSEISKFVSGDIIAFRSGDVFYGSLLLSNVAGITITSFGSGEKAILTGGNILNGWSKTGNNIYEHNEGGDVFQVFNDFGNLNNAKAPIEGYFTVSSVISQTEFISKDLIGQKDLTGATIHLKSYSWIIENKIISSFDSNTGRVTLNESMHYNMSSGDQFFVQNSIHFLKEQGDWSYDSSKGKVYLYSTMTPNKIRGSKFSKNGIEINNSNNVTIQNMSIKYFNNHGVYLNKSNNCKIESNEIINAYEIGIYDRSGANNLLRNNIISGSMYCGIKSDTDDVIIESNKISAIGLVEDLVYKRSWSSSGIAINGDRNKIRNNEIINVGYNGITFSGRDLLIINNYVQDFCQSLSDGGGIYTFNPSFSDPRSTGTTIQDNIVIQGDSFDSHAGVFCIYMDDKTHDIVIKGNSLSGSDRGIFLHNTKRVKVLNNIIYDALGHGISISEDSNGGNGETVDNIIEYNEVFLLNKDLYNFPLSFGSTYNNSKLGTSNYNKFYNPLAYENIGLRTTSIFGHNKNFPLSMDLSDWQKLSGNDLNSKENDFYWNSFKVIKIITPNLIKNSKFDNDLNNWGTVKANKTLAKDNGDNYLVGKSGSETGSVISNYFSVQQNNDYLLEFDIKSPVKSKFGLDIALGESPYGTEDRRQVSASAEWRHYAIPFSSNVTSERLKIEFSIFVNQEIHIDNVTFSQVEFSKEPLEVRSYFAYNKGLTIKDVVLPSGVWEDLSGAKYNGSIKLEPYKSKILILSEGSVSANAGEDKVVCRGENITLSASGGSSYKWSTGETTQSITVTPDKTTTYAVIVSEGSEIATDDVIVTVNEVLSNAGSDKTITEGESISLTATGGDSYLWSTGESTETITVMPNLTSTYTVTATKGGCEDTDDIIVTVNPSSGGATVVANAGLDRTICQGEMVTLSATGGSTFLWSTGATSQSIMINPIDTTIYSVTVSEGSDSDTDQVTVDVRNVVANAGLDRNILEGETITLVATGGDSYVWSTGEKTDAITINPTSTKTYSVTTYVGPCLDIDQVKVTVEPNVDSDSPLAQADAGEDITICLGETIILNGSGGETYIWSTGDTTSSISVSPNRTGTYELFASRGGVTNSDSVTITVENCDINDDESDGSFTDEEDLAILNMNIYPNPTEGEVFIRIDNLVEETNFIINDAKGSLIYSEYLSGQGSALEKRIDLKGFVKGVYFVRLVNSQDNIVNKLVLI